MNKTGGLYQSDNFVAYSLDLVRELGNRLTHAIILSRLHYRINGLKESNERQSTGVDHPNFFDGKWWWFSSYDTWRESDFFYWSKSKIQRAFNDLVNEGLIIKQDRFVDGQQQSNWWSIDYDAYNSLIETYHQNGRDDRGVFKMNRRGSQNEHPRVVKMTSREEVVKEGEEETTSSASADEDKGVSNGHDSGDTQTLDNTALNATNGAGGGKQHSVEKKAQVDDTPKTDADIAEYIRTVDIATLKRDSRGRIKWPKFVRNNVFDAVVSVFDAVGDPDGGVNGGLAGKMVNFFLGFSYKREGEWCVTAWCDTINADPVTGGELRAWAQDWDTKHKDSPLPYPMQPGKIQMHIMRRRKVCDAIGAPRFEPILDPVNGGMYTKWQKAWDAVQGKKQQPASQRNVESQMYAQEK